MKNNNTLENTMQSQIIIGVNRAEGSNPSLTAPAKCWHSNKIPTKGLIYSLLTLAAAVTASAQQPILSGPYQYNPNVTSAHSLGAKSVLVIRAHYPDVPSNKTLAQVQAVMDKGTLDNTRGIKQRFSDYSYGRTSLNIVVSTQDYLMPQVSSYYASRPTKEQCWPAIWDDATMLASADYGVSPGNPGSYNFVIVYTPTIPKFTGSKIGNTNYGSFGTPWVFMNGGMDSGIVTHELMHAFGSRHAAWWKPAGGVDPLAATGTLAENGDGYDVMGAAHQIKSDPNPWVKNHMGWIDDAQVLTVTAPGVTMARINRFDHPLATGLFALKIPRGDGSNIWVSIRRKWTTVPNEMTGAYIILGYNAQFNHSRLIDCNTPGTDIGDSALQVGQVLTDTAHGISIAPTAIGGVSPNEWMDVQVTR